MNEGPHSATQALPASSSPFHIPPNYALLPCLAKSQLPSQPNPSTPHHACLLSLKKACAGNMFSWLVRTWTFARFPGSCQLMSSPTDSALTQRAAMSHHTLLVPRPHFKVKTNLVDACQPLPSLQLNASAHPCAPPASFLCRLACRIAVLVCCSFRPLPHDLPSQSRDLAGINCSRPVDDGGISIDGCTSLPPTPIPSLEQNWEGGGF